MTTPLRATLMLLAALPLLPQTAPKPQPVPTMKHLMLDLIHPASSDIRDSVSLGGPKNDKEWTSFRQSALTLKQSAQTLLKQNTAEPWSHAAKLLSDAASAAYAASLTKNAKVLPPITIRIDASCTTCHEKYGPKVTPPLPSQAQ